MTKDQWIGLRTMVIGLSLVIASTSATSALGEVILFGAGMCFIGIGSAKGQGDE